MAVVECDEITGRDGSDDNHQNKRYRRRFRILCDSPTDGAGIVLACPDLPAIGDTWESVDGDGVVRDVDLDVFCVERQASSDSLDLYHLWIVTISYAGKGDPLLEPAEVTISSSKYQGALEKDLDGKWVRNSAGDPFEGGLTRDRTRFTIHIVQNVLDFNVPDAATYIDSVNADPVFFDSSPPGFDPGVCKLVALSAAAVWKENHTEIDFWRRTAVIEVNYDGWDAKILDVGFRKVKGGFRGPIFADSTGAGGKLSSAALLDGAGGELPLGGTPVFLTFKLYPTKDWYPLGFDWLH